MLDLDTVPPLLQVLGDEASMAVMSRRQTRHTARRTPRGGLNSTGRTAIARVNCFRMDTLSASERSERMSRVRSRDTKPEMRVRRIVHGNGYRYRLHVRALPGNPDIVFPSRQKVIFVHGCFWHRHPGCARSPKSKLDFWLPKLNANRERDLRNQEMLQKLGWNCLVIWECELKDVQNVTDRICVFLDGTPHFTEDGTTHDTATSDLNETRE